MHKLNAIIFSCDRACQLDLMLRSLEKMFSGWEDQFIAVNYETTSIEFQRGYDLVMKLHPGIRFFKRVDFKADLLKLCETDGSPYVTFFVDDAVFVRPFALGSPEFQRFEQDPSITCLSLALAPYTTFSYASRCPNPAPASLDPDLMVWDWSQATVDWGYPMSINGHIFRIDDLRPQLTNNHYVLPNSFEHAMFCNQWRMPNRLEICFADQRIIQIPVNKVQTENENHFGLALSYHQHDLNRMFLGGARIADEPFYDVKTPSIHWELGYRFV